MCMIGIESAESQFLQHCTLESILATPSGLLKYPLIISHLHSRPVFELVTPQCCFDVPAASIVEGQQA